MKEIKVVKTGINGEGIGYEGRTPIFIEGALKEEVVDIEVIESYPKYKKAKATAIHKRSIHRKEPECKYQERCGGCSLMICNVSEQTSIKKELVKEALVKYGKVDGQKIESVIQNPNPLYYRNQCKLPIQWSRGQLRSGLYEPKSNHLIAADTCLVHEKGLDDIRQSIMKILNKHKVRDYNEMSRKGFRNLAIRGFHGKFQCTFVTGKMEIDRAIIEDCMKVEGVESLYQNINTKRKTHEIFTSQFIHLAGEEKISLKMGGYELKLSPASFFQLNTTQAENLYNLVHSLISPCDFLVEAYSGIGAISLYVSDKAKQIVGIESNPDAVKNAQENAQLNQKSNVRFECGDAAKELSKLSEKIDALIVDPPRTGLSDEMLKAILKAKPKQFIYISCNPATLGKNLLELKKEYKVKRVIPIDIFSQTPHVETCVLLSHKNS